MKPEFIVLGLILAGALYLFWTQKLQTDVTAVLVMLCLVVPWPRPDGKWSAILSPQEAFSGFGKSVNWPAIATVGGMISLGLTLEKRTPLKLWPTPSSPVFSGPVRFPFFVPCWRSRLH